MYNYDWNQGSAETNVRTSFFGLRSKISVPPYFVAFVFKGGRLLQKLEAGVHKLWVSGLQVQLVDPRPSWIQIVGQELVTADGAPIRLSAVVHRSVSDLDRFAEVADSQAAVYVPVQLALRDQVLPRTLEALNAERAQIEQAMADRVSADIAPLGMTVDRLAIRDLTLLGETKRAYAEVVQAQLQARASLERARGEAATMRSLLNTAELVRKNPELLQLRALQQMESGGNTVELNLSLPPRPEGPENPHRSN